jgi:hypothetical protein
LFSVHRKTLEDALTVGWHTCDSLSFHGKGCYATCELSGLERFYSLAKGNENAGRKDVAGAGGVDRFTSKCRNMITPAVDEDTSASFPVRYGQDGYLVNHASSERFGIRWIRDTCCHDVNSR